MRRSVHLFLIAALTLAGLVAPRQAAAQPDPLTNIGWCLVSPFAAGATSITVTPTGCGADLPGAAFNLSVCNITDNPANCRTAAAVKDTSYEIVRVTAGFGTDTFTIDRAEEGTSDVNHNTGGKTYAVSTFTAKTVNEFTTGFGAAPLFTPGTSANTTWLNERILALGASLSGTDGGAGSTYTVNAIQDIRTSASPTWVGATFSGLTADRLVTSSTGGLLQTDNFRVDSTNGFLGIGLTGAPDARLVVRHNWTPQTTTLGAYHEVGRYMVNAYGGGNGSTPRNALGIWITDNASISTVAIGNVAASPTSPLIRVTATAHGFTTGDAIGIYGITGTVSTAAEGGHDITVIDANNFDLQGSTHAGSYTSGGFATTRPALGGVVVNVQPAADRTSAGIGSAFNDDVTAFAVNNPTNFRATDAYYIGGGGPAGAPAWTGGFITDAASRFHFRATGKAYLAALDLSTVTYDGAAPAIDLGPAGNIRLDTATGTKIGTSTSQKMGFFGATPIVQPGSTAELKDGVLGGLGLIATGGAASLDLDGGALASGTHTFTDATNIVVGSTTGTKIGTATTQKIGFFNNTPIVQPSSTSELKDAVLGGLGLLATGGAMPLDLDGGALGSGTHTLTDGSNIVTGTTTGMQVGTGSTQKLGFWGATPVVRPSSTTDLRQALIDIGAYTTGGATPLNLNGGIFQTGTTISGSAAGFTYDPNGNFELAVVGGILGITKFEGSTTGAGFQLRKARGTSAAPRRSLSSDNVVVITGQSATAPDNTTNSVMANVAQVQMIAIEDHTATTTGTSIRLRSAPLGGSGLQDRYAAGNGKALTDNTSADVVSMTLASLTGTGGIIKYTITATDGTDIQVETGTVTISAVNKAAAFTVAVTEASQQSVSAGTLATTWAISSATPTVISVTADTSLSSSLVLALTFTFENLGRQAVTYP